MRHEGEQRRIQRADVVGIQWGELRARDSRRGRPDEHRRATKADDGQVADAFNVRDRLEATAPWRTC